MGVLPFKPPRTDLSTFPVFLHELLPSSGPPPPPSSSLPPLPFCPRLPPPPFLLFNTPPCLWPLPCLFKFSFVDRSLSPISPRGLVLRQSRLLWHPQKAPPPPLMLADRAGSMRDEGDGPFPFFSLVLCSTCSQQTEQNAQINIPPAPSGSLASVRRGTSRIALAAPEEADSEMLASWCHAWSWHSDHIKRAPHFHLLGQL